MQPIASMVTLNFKSLRPQALIDDQSHCRNFQKEHSKTTQAVPDNFEHCVISSEIMEGLNIRERRNSQMCERNHQRLILILSILLANRKLVCISLH